MAADSEHCRVVQVQRVGRGKVLLVRGKVEAAKLAAQQALQQAPEDADALCLMGGCLAASNDRVGVSSLIVCRTHTQEEPCTGLCATMYRTQCCEAVLLPAGC